LLIHWIWVEKVCSARHNALMVSWEYLQFILVTGISKTGCNKVLRAFFLPFPRYALISGAGEERSAGKYAFESSSKP